MIKESRRNLFVIHHSLRTFLVASVLSAIVNLLNTTIDGIVVSQRVSADAISVVVLVEPVITIVQLFGTMLFSGASLLVASAYGNQQFKLVNRLVTMSLTSVFILNGLLALVCCLFSEQIAHLLTDEERLLPLVTDYLPFTLAGCVVWMVCDAVGRYVKVSGRPKLVTNYVVLDTLLNLAFDLLLVVALDMGMQGAAIAGVISSILAMVVFVPYLSKPPRPFAFDRAKGCYLNLLGKSFQRGIPTAIAAFIMANGAAAMGRKVTIFFTFWGLNILRRPKKVRVKKAFIEKMFGKMMPRGTKKLGLSRMNMGGKGAKMIRKIMKKKGVSSLEELMQSAIDHGVRLVACQMSMDIMGIHKEELIDGVELGGVSTFLGSGEQSDMSLFI